MVQLLDDAAILANEKAGCFNSSMVQLLAGEAAVDPAKTVFQFQYGAIIRQKN